MNYLSIQNPQSMVKVKVEARGWSWSVRLVSKSEVKVETLGWSQRPRLVEGASYFILQMLHTSNDTTTLMDIITFSNKLSEKVTITA